MYLRQFDGVVTMVTRKFLTLLNFLFSDIDHLIFVNIFNMHICFSVSSKLALKIMLKVNLRQCEGFFFHNNIFFYIAQFFFFPYLENKCLSF